MRTHPVVLWLWHGAGESSIYVWRKRFGDVGTDDVKRLRNLEQENSRLKNILAERAGSIGPGSLRHRARGQSKTGLCAASSCKISFDLYVQNAD